MAAAPAWAEPSAEQQQPAMASAEAWLALTDAGDYAKSWDEAASYFQTAVTQAQWGQSLTAVRAPLGAVVSRTLRVAMPATRLPGAPDGEYVIIQYDTVFANKSVAVETVTPMRQADGAWKVAGYYIK